MGQNNNNSDDIKWLYGKLKAKGYNIGSEQEFATSLDNEEDRRWYYDKARGMGLNVGSQADFDNLFAPSEASTANNPVTSAGVSQPAVAPAQPVIDRPDSGSSGGRKADSGNAGMATYGGNPLLGGVDLNRRGEVFAKPVAVSAGTPYRQDVVMVQPSGKSFENTPEKEAEVNQMIAQADAIHSKSAEATREAKRYEEMSGKERLAEMRQAAKDYAIPHAYEEADRAVKAAIAADDKAGKAFDENGVVYGSTYARATARKASGYGDLDKITESAFENMNADDREALVSSYEKYYNDHPEEGTMPMLSARMKAEMAVKDDLRAKVNEKYGQRYKMNGADFFGSTMVDSNIFGTVMLGSVLPNGHAEIRSQAMMDYAGKHDGFWDKVGEFSAMGLGMMTDPTLAFTGFAGGAAAKGTTMLLSKALMPKVGTSLAQRAVMGGSKGYLARGTVNLAGAMAGGAVNLGLFEGAGEGARQLAFDNNIDLGGIWMQMKHGASMGAGVGVAGSLLGNVSGKLMGKAKAADSVAGMTAVKAGTVVAAPIVEGGVFSSADIYNIYTMSDADFDALYGQDFDYMDMADGAQKDEARRSARNSAAGDVFGDNVLMMSVMKAQNSVLHAGRGAGEKGSGTNKSYLSRFKDARRAFSQSGNEGGVKGALEAFFADGKRYGLSLRERIKEHLGREDMIGLTKVEIDELKQYGYTDLSEMFVKNPRVSEVTADGEKGIDVETGTVKRETSELADGSSWVRSETFESDGSTEGDPYRDYQRLSELMDDSRVAESVKQKLQYITFGVCRPLSTVAGVRNYRKEDGAYVVETLASDNNTIVTRNEYKDKKQADRALNDAMRQVELNTIELGEKAQPAKDLHQRMWWASRRVAAKYDWDAETVLKTFEDIMEIRLRGSDKELTGQQRSIVHKMDEELERSEPRDLALELRESIRKETGVDVDKALRKEIKDRNAAEKDAIRKYAEGLYRNDVEFRYSEPEQKQIAAELWMPGNGQESTPEQAEAQSQYEQGRDLYGRAEEGDPDAQADVDAIALRMQEAYQVVEDAFGSEAEYYMFHVNENPWSLVDDPELTVDQKDAVLYYINAKAALDGVMDAFNETYDRKRAEAEERIAKRTHRENGVIIPATMKVDDRLVYIVKGDVVMFPDGTAVDVRNSSESVIVMDLQTGEYEFTSPDQISRVFESVNPQDEVRTEQEIIKQFQYVPGRMAEVDDSPAEGPADDSGVPDVTDGSDGKIGNDGREISDVSDVSALGRIPINEQGEPMFEAVDKETSWEGLVEAAGSETDAAEIALAQVQQATADLEALKKKPPTMKAPKLKGSPMAMAQAKREAAEQYQRDITQYNQQIADTQARLDAWNGIVGVYNSRNAELHRQQEEERRQRDAIAHEQAVARFEEEQRIKAEKQAEQERIGVHAVNPKIKEKWDTSPKVEGNVDAITLPDGSTLTGRYVLTEAGAASPSHDVNNAYQPTDGFPIDENGQSVNDRDYMRDKDAQQKVEGMAGNYDNRALQDPVIVSRDGVVLSGNNRTMSGDLAAGRGTDKAYVDYLARFGHKKFGFTPEQVTGMKNPRVVFVPDETLPYDATTFARFNAQEKKSQGKPEAAVKLGKIVPDNVFNSIAGDISRYDRLSDYYADEKAVAQALGALMQSGVINDMQMPELRTGMALSATGRELIENTLIGKAFQTSPDAVRQIISTPALRQAVVLGLNEIALNRTLNRSGYDVSDELAKAIDLVIQAKAAMPDVYTEGMPVSSFGRQQGLFDDEFGDSRVTDATTLLLADILNSGRPSDLRKILTTYNNEASQASGGQMDMFSGSIPTKEEILTTVNEHFRNATPKEQQALVDAAILRRREAASRSAAEADAEQRERSEASEQTPHDDERRAEPQQPTAGVDDELTPEEQALAARVEITENDWEEGDGDNPTYKRDIIIDGTHKVTQVDTPDEDGHYTGSYFEFDGKRFGDIAEIAQYIDGGMQAEPTDAQKAAGNYKMEHRRVDGYNISIENTKGSVRRGTGADGKPWETTMQNDYGYIRGTEGVDGDHIDVFLSDTPEEGDVFVVDQVKEDGSFDEHKVMYGFPTEQVARDAYLSNYEPGWTGLGAITHVSKDEFKKWIQSSRRKTKPFADYVTVKKAESASSQGSVAEYKSVKIYKEQNPQLAIEPDGFGDFGPIFMQFKGDAQGAIKVLSELQDGEAIGALHHKDIGDIDLVWGNAGTGKSDGFGLAKLVKFHPEVVEHLQEILDDMYIVKRSENRINLESDTHKAAVRLTWNKEKKKWLLTAFEKRETSESIGKTTDTDDNPSDLRGDTALSQNSDVSDGKVNTFFADSQISKDAKRLTVDDSANNQENKVQSDFVDESADKQTESAESSQGSDVTDVRDVAEAERAGDDARSDLEADLEGVRRGLEADAAEWLNEAERVRDDVRGDVERRVVPSAEMTEGERSAAYEEQQGDEAEASRPEQTPENMTASLKRLFDDKVANEDRRIEDFGEKIAGARKDMLGDLARSVENVTVQSLIELPMSKAFRRPNLKRMVDAGVISDSDATLAEGVLYGLIYAKNKPVATSSPRRKREIAEWAQETYNGIRLLGEILSGDPARRDAALAESQQRQAQRLVERNAYIDKLREWNPEKDIPYLTELPDEVMVIGRVLEAIGHRTGDKVDLPLSRISVNSAGHFEVVGPGKQGARWFKRYHDTLDEAVAEMALAARIARGDTDVELPQRVLRVKGVGKPHLETTGKYVVDYWKGKTIDSKVFGSEEEAEAFAEKHNGKVSAQQRYVNEYDSYTAAVVNPMTGNTHAIGREFADRAELAGWMDESHDELNRLAVEAINSENGAKGGSRAHFYVASTWNTKGERTKMRYSVVEDDKLNPWPVVKDFDSRKEAEEWLSANMERLEGERRERRRKMASVVFFEGGERAGKDRRGGRHATPEMYNEAFGFRGVQFGNWTSAEDRQMAMDQAYDAFMDLSEQLGLSPRAMSLGGELALAFGARGSGGAAAHYEPGEVVINLTKPQGAGSLAHEWWHALDNYLSRKAGVALGHATHGNGIETMPADVAMAICDIVDAVENSEYGKRSALKGDYWGRNTEMGARLFESWISERIKDGGELSPFLASGLSENARRIYQELNYLSYRADEMRKAEAEKCAPQVMGREEFFKRAESLNGYPYPTLEELKVFAPLMEDLFRVLSERERNNGMMVSEPRRRYGAKHRPLMTGKSLFDWADGEEQIRRESKERSEETAAAEEADAAIDDFGREYDEYLAKIDEIESQLSEADEALRAELSERMEAEEGLVAESRRRLEDKLREFYVRGNMPEDAERIARDMAARVMAEIDVRRNGGRLLSDILEGNVVAEVAEVADRPCSADNPEGSAKAERTGEVRTAGGYISYEAMGHLPDAERGEFAFVERQFSRTGEFSFTGSETVKDAGDVAYILRALEDYSVENVFAVLVKDGKAKILHIGLGMQDMSMADMGAIRAGVDAFGADKVYLVHNHPSGNLTASEPDRALMRRLEAAYEGKLETEGVIMDTRSGRYTTFDGHSRMEMHDRKQSGDGEAAEVYRFDHTDREREPRDPEEMARIRMASDVSGLLEKLRFGESKGVSYLLLNTANRVVGNFHTEYEGMEAEGLASEIASTALKYGARRVIVYGHDMELRDSMPLNERVRTESLDGIEVLDAVRVDRGLTRSAYDEGLMRESESEYGSAAEGASMVSEAMVSGRGKEAFDELRDRAVAERGVVMPGLNEAEVRVVDVPHHDFTGDSPISNAREWAKENLVGKHWLRDSEGKEVPYYISGRTLGKYLTASATEKSENLGVHLSVLTKLPEVISESIETEVHPDYKKGDDGKRSPENGYNDDNLIHRFYGAVTIDGKPYIVKTTITESRNPNETIKPHSYEVNEIELLPKDNSSIVEPTASDYLGQLSHRTAKLLEGVEKSYDKGVKLLEKSEKRDSTEINILDKKHKSTGDGNKYRDGAEMSDGDRLRAIRALEPISVDWNELSRDELREIYNNLPVVEKDGREIEFYRSAFKKIYKDGGMFGQVVPVLDEVLSHSILAYSEADNLGGLVRPDGTMHKAHPNVDSFDNYVGKVNIDGKEYYVRTTVKREIGQAGAHSFFVSNVSLYEKDAPRLTLPNFPSGESDMEQSKNPTESRTNPITSRGATDFNGIVDAKLQQFFDRASSEANILDMRDRVNELSERLNLPVRILRTPEEIKGYARNAREAGAKGLTRIVRGGNQAEEIAILLPNNNGVADVENTFMHEVVGHDGLRMLFPTEELLNNALDELYRASNGSIKADIDRMTRQIYDAEVDRIFHERQASRSNKGEADAKYYADMAAAHTKANARRDEMRREATEEYGADLAGKIGEKGFEKMTADERTFWGKLKGLLQQAFEKLLRGLKIPKMRKWNDKQWAYIYHKAYKMKKSNGRLSVIDEAEDIVMRRRTGWDEAMQVSEKRARIEKLRRSEPVEVTDKMIPEGLNLTDRKAVKSALKEVVRRTVVNEDNGQSISVFKDGINEVTSHGMSDPAHVKSLFAIPEMLRKSIYIDERRNEKSHTDFEKYQYYVCGLRIDGEDYTAKIVVGVKGSDRYYDHRLSHIEKGKLIDSLNGLSNSEAENEQPSSGYKGTTLESLLQVPDDGAVVRFRDPDLGLEETITKMKAEAMQANTDNLQAKRDAMRAIGGNLNHLRQAMARQREYDITTVKSVADLARVLMDNNLLDDLSKYETKRILGAINNVVGKQDVSQYVQKVMDIMVDNQLRMGANTLGRLLSIRDSRVDARGIEVQGELDPDGQRIAQVVRTSTTLHKDDIDNRIAEAINRMSSTDQAIADEATLEYAGLQIARQYVEDITESKAEEKALRDSIKQAKEDKDAGQMTESAYRQYVASTEDAIRQNKIERAQAFHSLVEQIGSVLSESVERAKAWREAEKQRVEEIHHNANSDMEGRPTDEHHKDDRMQKLANNSGVRFLLAPLATFDQMLRMFGKKNSRGEGYLWNRYMRDWVTATEKEYTGYRDALKVLDAKVSEIYGKDMTWGDLFTIDRKLPRASVRFFDGGEMKDHELTQGNLLYIYMADKMSDGRMKLRRMGITEEDIEDIKNFLDPKFMQLADWMQEEFLASKRNEYNEVHKRMFGASMAAIENYFPLKILANARLEDVDVAEPEAGSQLPATSTGSIIKRRRNNLALDVTGANAFSVILDHLQQMERWAAFAEFNRDLNTLLSYKRFRNQVMNMSSVYGAGKTLWNNFRNVCSMAAGAYRPPIAALDKSAVNIAKGVTAAKVSFRVFTALKQFLSMPAYASDSNPLYLASNIANPMGAWRWSMKNLPLFEKRWSSRMAGDPRLLKSDMDWKMWRSRIVEIASRVGMSPNAFVDALTVAIGSHSMYQTKLAKYKRQGYAPDVAEARAKQDATILFNQTQQSSEGAFLSTMQVDRSWLSVLFTVFRNSSMSYTRQLYDSIRNLGRRFTPDYKGLSEEFMAKQMRRDGIDPDKADRNAKQEYRRGIIRDLVRVGVFGYVLQLAWNLGAYLPYLILGEDEEEKDKMWQDVWNHTMFGSIEGLTGGDVMSAAGNMWVSGEGNPQYLTKDMPLASDVLSILKKMDKDQVSAMNDVINLLVQSAVGVNPQSLTDAVVAVMDVCGNDAQTSRECALLMARVINCPQNQLDKIYFDELDMTGSDASRLTPMQIAERYAEYKMLREAPLTGWMRNQEASDSIKAKKVKRVLDNAKDRIEAQTNERANIKADWLSDYESVKSRLSEIRKIREEDEDRYYEQLDELQLTPEYERYLIIKSYRHDLQELSKGILHAKDGKEMQQLTDSLITLKRNMVRELSDTQQ